MFLELLKLVCYRQNFFKIVLLFERCQSLFTTWVHPPLRKELREFVEEHNAHRIRKQRGKKTPQGIPKDLYSFPELKGMVAF